MDKWRTNPVALPNCDRVTGRLPKLTIVRRAARVQQLEMNELAPQVHDPNQVETPGGSENVSAGVDGGRKRRGKDLMIDLNEAEAVEELALAPPPPPPPAPAVEVVAPPIAGGLGPFLKVVKWFDLNEEPEEEEEGMDEEIQLLLGAMGFPIRVMKGLGGPTSEAGSSNSSVNNRHHPRILFAPDVPPAPTPPPPEGLEFAPSSTKNSKNNDHIYHPTRLVRVAVNLGPAPDLWMTGTLWKYDVARQDQWLVHCDCHSMWKPCLDFLKHAGWGWVSESQRSTSTI